LGKANQDNALKVVAKFMRGDNLGKSPIEPLSRRQDATGAVRRRYAGNAEPLAPRSEV
jgi:hypothetical protein